MTDEIRPRRIAVEIEAGEKSECLAGMAACWLVFSFDGCAAWPRGSPEPRKTASEQVACRERAARFVGFARGGRIVYSLRATRPNKRHKRASPWSMGLVRGLLHGDSRAGRAGSGRTRR